MQSYRLCPSQKLIYCLQTGRRFPSARSLTQATKREIPRPLMAPAALSYRDQTFALPGIVILSRLVPRDQSEKSVPMVSINTIIALTVILGVLFIAFALAWIYWLYMRKIDRKARLDRERTHKMLRSKTVSRESPDSGSQRRTGPANPRSGGGRGHSRSKIY